MSAFKKLFGSKSSKTKDTPERSSSKVALSEPLLTPGHYGRFPPAFNIFYAGSSVDKKSDIYFLAENVQAPIYAITVYKKGIQHQITLHSGPSTDAPPLALAGNEKAFSAKSIIAVPGPLDAPSANQIERMRDVGSMTKIKFAYSVVVGTAPNQHPENFEFRGEVLPQRGDVRERKLVRMNVGPTGETEEVIGVWMDEDNPQKESRMGSFQFQGSGSTGELGDYWLLVTVAALIRNCQITWIGAVAADQMIKGLGKVLGSGLGMGLGMVG